MKAIILFISLLSAAIIGNAQSGFSPQKYFGISYTGLGDNDAIHYTRLIGSASHRGRGFYGIQAEYMHSFNRIITFETGIGYQQHQFTQYNHDMDSEFYEQSMENDFHVSFLTIPIGIRVNFLKYAFINTGATISASLESSEHLADQSGLGLYFGGGLKYELKSGLGIYVNPVLGVNSILSVSKEQYPERIVSAGFKFGLTYQIQLINNIHFRLEMNTESVLNRLLNILR